MRMMQKLAAGAMVCVASIVTAQEAPAPTRAQRAEQMAQRAIEFLRTQQDASGAWGVREGAPSFPAITGLVLVGMRAHDQVKAHDDAAARGLAYILGQQKPDGGIYDVMLPSYNTSICISALATFDTREAKKAIERGVLFLKSLQYGEAAMPIDGSGESAAAVDRTHAFYGGWGYGRHGRPDLSNTAFALEALHAAGVDPKDAAFQRALVFLQRCQMMEKGADGRVINEAVYAKGSRQGGFIYATSVSKDEVGVGQSFAGTMEETLDDGSVASRLRSYGSMTYSGFKSYLYAGLSSQDPRVLAAMDWIGRNYTLDENPGVGTDGLYYYYVVFARAMHASGKANVRVINAAGDATERAWADDLVVRLATLQQPDGSFKVVDDRWMENDPVLITAYSLIALQQAR